MMMIRTSAKTVQWCLVLLTATVCCVQASDSVEEAVFNIGPKIFALNNASRPDNLILSPVGLSFGLGQIHLAANDDLKQLIVENFFDLKPTDALPFHTNISVLLRKLNIQSQPAADDKQTLEMNIHCAVFYKDSIPLSPQFTRLSAAIYDSEMIALSANGSANQHQAVINEWANRSTKGLIPEFAAPKQIQGMLANVVYFEGDWLEPFALEYTRPGVFYSSGFNSSDPLNVTYMHGQQEVDYYEDGEMGFKMVRLPYVVQNKSANDVSMYVILPTDFNLEAIIANLTFSQFRTIVQKRMVVQEVNIRMPKVSLKRRINVKQYLDLLMHERRLDQELFESYRTDPDPRHSRNSPRTLTRRKKTENNQLNYQLSSATNSTDLYLTEFVQETVMEVNEKGTKVTSISGGYINYDSLTKRFRIESPYLMIIYDSKLDLVLFWGAIYRPLVEWEPRAV